jgi:hypothetical protein
VGVVVVVVASTVLSPLVLSPLVLSPGGVQAIRNSGTAKQNRNIGGLPAKKEGSVFLAARAEIGRKWTGERTFGVFEQGIDGAGDG